MVEDFIRNLAKVIPGHGVVPALLHMKIDLLPPMLHSCRPFHVDPAVALIKPDDFPCQAARSETLIQLNFKMQTFDFLRQ